MKILYIDVKYDKEINLDKNIIEKLPKNLILVTTIQFLNQFKSLKKQLEDYGKNVILVKDKYIREGQIIGCSNFKIKKDFDAFLYVGTGRFHIYRLAKYKKPVYVYNPINNTFNKFDEEELESINKRRRGSLMKFLKAKKIGILISTKAGQYNLKKAFEIEKKFRDKEYYYFISDEIKLSELEDFNFIEVFINTACPGIFYDKSSKTILNMEDVGYEF